MEHIAAGGMPSLCMYDLIIVDEISQLEGWQSDHIMKLWNMAEKAPALAILGDKGQMAGFGEVRPWHTNTWKKATWSRTLHQVYRCKDAGYQEILDALRTATPSDDLLEALQARTIWGKDPSADAVRKLLHAHPETTILSCSRWGAHNVNICALQALYPNYPPRAVIDGDIESYPENYVGGKLKAFKNLKPTPLPIYIGMQVYLTRNIRKDIDFVNGMLATVESYDSVRKIVRVRTATGHPVAVFPWTDTDMGNWTYYPMRAGYASTVLKFQGAELKHVTMFLDASGVPGAAYTAMSRVATRNDVLLAGLLTAEHFTPAA